MTDAALDLLDTARLLAREAGEFAVSQRDSVRVAHTKSSDVDIVTHVDMACEALLRERISQLRPGDGILGEEGDDVVGASGVTWVLDPIDGTVNYLYGLPNYAVSVAAVTGPPRTREWTAIAGAVYDGMGRMWSAAHNKGAWRDETRLVAGSGPQGLAHALLGTGFQYVAPRRAAQGRLVAALLPQVRDIRRQGAAALDLCLVAAGQLDAYYEHGLHAWDLAAGALIAREAGMRVGGLGDAPPTEELTIAAHPAVWDELRDALATAGARDLFLGID